MDLPVFRKGLELVSSQLNKLSNGIRAAQITSVIGGSFTRTPAGTTLIIGAQPGGGGGGSAAYCNFKVSDYTAPGDTDLIVSVQQDKINGRYPIGMNGEGGTFTLAIPAAWAANVNWVGIYIIIEVNEFGQIRPEPEAIRVQASLIPLNGLENNQAFLLSEITISKDEENKPYISNINNACPLIEPSINGLCPFQISDVFNSLGTAQQIQIRTGTIEGRYPNGMSLGSVYEIEIPDDGEWHAVYCVLSVDQSGNIQPGNTSISFALFNDYQTNTNDTQFVLIGEITTSYLEAPLAYRYVSFIQNYCIIPAPQRSSIICNFQISNASTENQERIIVNQQTVQTNNPFAPYIWPDGMGIGFPPFYVNITASGYVYLGINFNTSNYYAESAFIEFSEEIKPNEEAIQYILLATINVDVGLIKEIQNVCSQSVVNPCLLPYTPPQPI